MPQPEHMPQQTGESQHAIHSTLLAASVDLSDRLELVEYADGSMGINVNDSAINGYLWEAARADEAIRTYLRMVRRADA